MIDSGSKPVALIACDGGGVRLTVRVKPGGRGNRLIGAHAEALKVEVTAAPERGKANTAVVKLLAAAFGVQRNAVEIVGGLSARCKTVVVHGTASQEIADRLKHAGIPAKISNKP